VCLLSIGTGWVTTNGVPVFVSTGPELNDEFLHPRKFHICVPGSGVEFVAFGIFVSVVVADERQILQRSQVQCVLPTGRVGICVGRPSDEDVLDESGFDVGVAVREFVAHPSPIGLSPNTISVLGMYPTAAQTKARDLQFCYQLLQLRFLDFSKEVLEF
jgi:hypothetical protein